MTEPSSEGPVLQRLIDQVNQHIETRWEYLTLTAAEKMSEIAAMLAGAFMLLAFGGFILFFFSIGFAWWLGDYINSRAGGFALAGLIFLPVALVSFWWIRPFVRAKIIHAILQENDAAKNR